MFAAFWHGPRFAIPEFRNAIERRLDNETRRDTIEGAVAVKHLLKYQVMRCSSWGVSFAFGKVSCLQERRPPCDSRHGTSFLPVPNSFENINSLPTVRPPVL